MEGDVSMGCGREESKERRGDVRFLRIPELFSAFSVCISLEIKIKMYLRHKLVKFCEGHRTSSKTETGLLGLPQEDGEG